MTHGIVHAGTHKTGTTSVQSFLNDNKPLLEPFLHYYGKAVSRQPGLMPIFLPSARFSAQSSPAEEAKQRRVFDASAQAR